MDVTRVLFVLALFKKSFDRSALESVIFFSTFSLYPPLSVGRDRQGGNRWFRLLSLVTILVLGAYVWVCARPNGIPNAPILGIYLFYQILGRQYLSGTRLYQILVQVSFH